MNSLIELSYKFSSPIPPLDEIYLLTPSLQLRFHHKTTFLVPYKIHFLSHKLNENGFDSRGLATVLYSTMRIFITKHKIKIFDLSKWLDKASAAINKFNGQELANSIYALAKLQENGFHIPQNIYDFLSKWLDKASMTIVKFNSQNLANSLYALAALQYKGHTLNHDLFENGINQLVNQYIDINRKFGLARKSRGSIRKYSASYFHIPGIKSGCSLKLT